MNKFIIFSCLFVLITSTCGSIGAKNWKDCKNKTLDDSEKTGGEDSCCFLSYENNTKIEVCAAVSKDGVAELVKKYQKQFKTYSIDCSSNWISYSLFLIALIFMI